jgi:hypothetical protein
VRAVTPWSRISTPPRQLARTSHSRCAAQAPLRAQAVLHPSWAGPIMGVVRASKSILGLCTRGCARRWDAW